LLSELVSRLRGAFGETESPAEVPEGLRLYAVGDIHGRDDLLGALLDQVRGDARQQPASRSIVIFLGDYIDRGLQSRQVLDRLSGDPMPGFECVFLKGNHEQALLQFLDDAAFGRTWKHYGGLETLHSYGISELALSDDPANFERARDRLEEMLPESHRRFLKTLQLSTEFGGYFFAHAGVRPGIPLDRQSEEDLLWIRDDFLDTGSSFGKVIVHGHTPREAVVFRPNRIGVDTGAYMTGKLTALVLEGTGRRLLQTGASHAPLAATGQPA
tara:strand:- start:284 stop:1096 length:813 start_codon:yes stop_codon:yes gene_type:complete